MLAEGVSTSKDGSACSVQNSVVLIVSMTVY